MEYTLSVWNLNAINNMAGLSKRRAIKLARIFFNSARDGGEGGVGVRVKNEAGQVIYEKRPGWKKAKTGADNII